MGRVYGTNRWIRRRYSIGLKSQYFRRLSCNPLKCLKHILSNSVIKRGFMRLMGSAKKPLGEGLLHMEVVTAPLCNAPDWVAGITGIRIGLSPADIRPLNP